MNYIWEILLRARAQGLSDNELFFAQAEDCSPWYEQSFPCLNEDTVTGPVVEINSLYRFSEIFQDLLHNMGDSEYLRHLFDAAVHILAAQETIAQALQLLSEEQKRGVASLLLAQYETGSSLLVFRQALTALYPQAMLYQLKPHPEQLLLYLGLANADRRIVQMLEDLFLPLQYQVRIFWTKHFGVWDVDATLVFDEIEIY